MDFPKISIVTASYNQVQYIEECILSVIAQDYPNLEYIVIDGGSTDGTVDIIRKYEKHLHYWVTEKDNGLYHALNKGFLKSTGEIMGWLNSDDILHRKSLFTIAEIFAGHQQVKWLQGYPTVVDEMGRIIYHRPPRYSKLSFYMKEYHDGIFIQQESTYWKREIWLQSGEHISTAYKYAGDFELWMRFYNVANLFVTNSLIGAFRSRGEGQLSADNYQAYLNECDSVIDASVNNLEKEELALLKKAKLTANLSSRLERLTGYLPGVKHGRTMKGKKVDFDIRSKQFIIS
jgi:glycosyltransferase involved in cell wall biosynthesis